MVRIISNKNDRELGAGVDEARTAAEAMMVAPNRALASHAIIATEYYSFTVCPGILKKCDSKIWR
jgi:LDH2 family malate/lactate/ureidoglycolate dehydrogenase